MPTGSYKNGSPDATILPTIYGGKGFGRFRNIRPANTITQVVRFIDPDWLVEIESDAVVED